MPEHAQFVAIIYPLDNHPHSQRICSVETAGGLNIDLHAVKYNLDVPCDARAQGKTAGGMNTNPYRA